MRVLPLCFLGCMTALVKAQPPAINQNGVTNLASRIPSSLMDRALARGAAFSIQGVRLGTDTSSTHLEFLSEGRSITIPARSVRPGQIQGVLPENAPLGPGSLIVETPDGRSKPFSVRVVSIQPGLFSVNGLGWGQGQIQMLNAGGGRRPNSMGAPIRRGGTAVIDATGLGDARLAQLVIGGVAVRPLSIHHSSGLGVDHIRFRVSRSVPQGCFVPVYLRIGSSRPSNVVSIAIEDNGSSCRLPIALPQPESKVGLISIARMEAYYSETSPMTTMEQAVGAFYRPSASDENQYAQLLGPPEGTCTTVYGDDQVEAPSLTSLGDIFARSLQGRGLRAGPSLSISGSAGIRVIPALKGQTGSYSVRLGLEEPGRRPAPPLFLNDPEYTVSVPGADIEPFASRIAGPPTFHWINRTEVTFIDRNRGATFEWRDVPPDARLVIAVTAANSVGAARGICDCAVNATSGRFTIPAEMLANLPPTEPTAGPQANMVFLIALRAVVNSPGPVRGLDQLHELSIYATGQRVTYR